MRRNLGEHTHYWRVYQGVRPLIPRPSPLQLGCSLRWWHLNWERWAFLARYCWSLQDRQELSLIALLRWHRDLYVLEHVTWELILRKLRSRVISEFSTTLTSRIKLVCKGVSNPPGVHLKNNVRELYLMERNRWYQAYPVISTTLWWSLTATAFSELMLRALKIDCVNENNQLKKWVKYKDCKVIGISYGSIRC